MFQYIPRLFYFVMELALPLVLLFTGTSKQALDYSDKLGKDYTGLQAVYEDYFEIGTAMQSGWIGEGNEELEAFYLKNYSSFTSGNGFKVTDYYFPDGHFETEALDEIAQFCRDHNLKLRGHTLIWPTLDTWLPYNPDGSLVDKETLYARMDTYIGHIMTRYGDIIDDWDVVNEIFHYNSSPEFKDYNDMFTIAGMECIEMAFKIAEDYADENDRFFINETKVLNNPAKEKHLFKYLDKWLNEDKLKIDGVGLQCHLQAVSTAETPERLQKIIDKIRDRGLIVHLTELEMSAYIDNEQTLLFDKMPDWMEIWQKNKYQRFFKVLRDNCDVVKSVTFWGYQDGMNFPSREDWPFLFDKFGNPKENFFAVCDFPENKYPH